MSKTLIALAAVAALALTACGGGSNAVVQAGESCLTPSEPAEANFDPYNNTLTVNEDYAVVNSQGQDDDVEFDFAGYFAALCVLEALDAPEYVNEQMGSTRPLDGRQSTSWDGYTAEWTYHPDDGLDVLFYMTEES